ncbi:TPA: DUF3829 domain-containing protein [Elizabethkingia anophelis]|uniref:YiiG family protein n=1 Tax=Elizabethkingia anophelis TaxID=1117645 RepID=UPI0021A6537C|nr:DUF3829 domain-containing protein [Elizabethkingia anophelis]MCT3873584.1 DUF3829 domain-containing protein [Elizabethkingia anophelis]MDV3846162.1 hypothetical protein [Elizabethkingia anophelis]HBN6703383.1 DUF3829 domain-containing protein [Elizabethkingia anophelis]HBN6707701.1 DUF3829 domain-containing protein [Elizabethkingia anophelis]
MKKITIAAGIFVFISTATSCDKIKEKLSQQDKTTKVNPFSVDSGDENRDIIAFNNKMVKMDKAQSDYIKSFEEAITSMDDFVKNALANPNAMRFTPVSTPISTFIALEEIKAPKVLGGEYQKLADKMISTFKDLKTLQEELSAYKNAEDWKDDKGKKIAELKAKSQKIIDENRNAASQLFTKLEDKADKAEMEMLKTHPLKQQIIQSKEILDLTQKIIDDSYDIKDEAAYKKLFAQQYQQLEKLYNRNLENKIPSAEKNKEASYNLFNNAVNIFLGKMRIVQRSMNESNDQLMNDLDDLEREAKTVLSRYNNFVD